MDEHEQGEGDSPTLAADRRIGPGALIEDFLYQYESRAFGRSLMPAERMLAEEVLFDFLTNALDHNLPDQCSGAIRLIREVAGKLDGEWTQHGNVLRIASDVVERSARRHVVQLRRRERSFEIMREHLVVLSAERAGR
jgi:hypothetical protein